MFSIYCIPLLYLPTEIGLYYKSRSSVTFKPCIEFRRQHRTRLAPVSIFEVTQRSSQGSWLNQLSQDGSKIRKLWDAADVRCHVNRRDGPLVPGVFDGDPNVPNCGCRDEAATVKH